MQITKWCRHVHNQILIKYDEKGLSANLLQKCLIRCSKVLLKVVHNTSLKSVVSMATYWVPDLSNIKGISGHLQRSIFIFANGA